MSPWVRIPPSPPSFTFSENIKKARAKLGLTQDNLAKKADIKYTILTKEAIKNVLMANGWQTQDIEESFSAISTSTPPKQYANLPINAPKRVWKILVVSFKGSEVNKCNFYLRTEKIDLVFPANIPQEVVSQQKEIYKKLEGRDGTCKFNTSDLTAMLTRWKKGTFKSGTVSCKLTLSGNVCKTEGGDFGVAECQGTYFEQPSL